MTGPGGDAMVTMWSSGVVTLLGLCLVAVAACAQSSSVPQGGVAVPMQRILSGQDSGFEQPCRDVIKTAAEWQPVGEKLRRGREYAGPIPAPDFGRSMVIVAAMGTQSTGGYAIAIENVYRATGRLWVVVRETRPDPGGMTTQVLTAPVDVVSVPRSEEPVSFVAGKEAPGCRS